MDPKATEVASAFDKYLSSGDLSGQEPSALSKLIDDRMRLEAQQSLKNAVQIARRLVKVSAGKPSPLPLTSYRVLARMTHMSAKHAEAEGAYLKARALSRSDKMVAGRIDRALIDVYMYIGDLPEAKRRANSALKIFRQANATADVAMTQVNLANLLHRQDKHRDAEAIYAQAEEYFRGAGDELSVARCQYNRANTLVQLFDFAAAEPLYISSRDIYLKHSFSLDATDARYGLAWMAMLRGQFHIALMELAECESAYRQFGQPKGAAVCELDRAEVYLGLNLLSDAYETAKSAETQFKKMDHRYEGAKASLFRAKAAFGLGLTRDAENALDRAIAGFEAEKNVGFLGASYLLGSQLAKDKPSRATTLRHARGKFIKAQLPLWEAVCDLHTLSETPNHVRAQARLTMNAAVREVPHLFAHWQTIEGDIAMNSGNTRQAIVHWQKAADRLDAVRAQLPPLEFRNKYGTSVTSPHVKLIESELWQSGERAAAWSERYKTAGVWAPLSELSPSHEQRRRAEQSLIELASQVAALSRQIGRSGGERGSLTIEAHRSVAQLQKKVRLEMAAAERSAVGGVDSIEQIIKQTRAISREMPVVQFHLSSDKILAFVHQAGTSRIVAFPNGHRLLTESMRQWRFILETELLADHLSSKSKIAAEEQFFASLGERFWSPLEIDPKAGKILVIPEGDLANLPWQAMIVLGKSLMERHQFVLSPSLRHFTHAQKFAVRAKTIELFEGASEDLPMVSHELQGLARRSPSTSRIHLGATRADWPSDGESWIWHYSGHAHLRPDNPFYSSLQLVDGPMFAADFRLREARVGLVTLAACRSGQQVALPGEESTGLVRSLLEMGARNVIAGYWPVSDRSTALWMNRFYERYIDGETLLQSAREAALAVRETYPSAYHWAAFAVHGAGE